MLARPWLRPCDEGRKEAEEVPVKTLRHVASVAVLTVPLWLSATVATACPICHTETGKKVRAGIFNDEFASNAAMTLLPFPVLIAAVAFIHFGPPRWSRFAKRETHMPTHR
jgi:hypothetical protein